MTDKDREALASACTKHLKSGGDVITEAAFASGWKAAGDHYASRDEVPMGYLLRLLGEACVEARGLLTWEDGLRFIRRHVTITAKPTDLGTTL
jgi:hypothetical protein